MTDTTVSQADGSLTQQELVQKALAIVAERAKPGMGPAQKDGLLEQTMMSLLDRNAAVPYFGRVGKLAAGVSERAGGRYLMHEDPRLPEMPEKPTLIDFFKRRNLLKDGGGHHLLQSANLARKNGLRRRY